MDYSLFMRNIDKHFSTEHLDFMDTMDTDVSLTQFRQLEHDYIGYQSLTDVPRAMSYSEELKEYSVRVF